MSSELRVDSIGDSSGTGPVSLVKQSAAKAWSSYNAITSNILESFNVSSVTNNATGSNTYNLTNAMSSSTYSPTGITSSSTINDGNSGITNIGIGTITSSSVRVWHTFSSNSGAYNPAHTNIQAFGDLA